MCVLVLIISQLSALVSNPSYSSRAQEKLRTHCLQSAGRSAGRFQVGREGRKFAILLLPQTHKQTTTLASAALAASRRRATLFILTWRSAKDEKRRRRLSDGISSAQFDAIKRVRIQSSYVVLIELLALSDIHFALQAFSHPTGFRALNLCTRHVIRHGKKVD